MKKRSVANRREGLTEMLAQEERPHSRDVLELLERLHRTRFQCRDEAFAPAVDLELLRLLARGELSPRAARRVFWALQSYESWRSAFRSILVDEFERAQREKGRPS
jgi:hypothetical protein